MQSGLDGPMDDAPRSAPEDSPSSMNPVTARIVERARQKLVERGFDPADAFPARLVRDLLPTHGRRRMCLEAIYRAIARGHLEAVRIGREWFTTIEGFARWVSRRSHGVGSAVDSANDPSADAAHDAVRGRLLRGRKRGA